jgi:CDGSH-type Zn-finger protein
MAPVQSRFDETPGKRAYCTCGWSAKLPHCDGAHQRMHADGCAPVIVEITTAEKKWCASAP